MIRSRDDYLRYVDADRLAMARSDFLRTFFLIDPVWSFLLNLRKLEYYNNCKFGLFSKIYIMFLRFKNKIMQLILGYTIPLNVIGPGINLPHYGPIIVHNNARIGANCRINICVVIGENNGCHNVPKIGDGVVIEPGAKIFGNVEIANGVHIGANSVVNKSFMKENSVIAGVPAKIIR